MVPGSIADYLQAAALLGGLAGLAGALWASMTAETTEETPRILSRPPATQRGPRRRAQPGQARLPSDSLAYRPARSSRVRTGSVSRTGRTSRAEAS